MIGSGVGVFRTRTSRQLLISRVPTDRFKQAGQRNSVLAKVVTFAGKPTTVQLNYVAVLPEPEGT
jgi:hypothetical protein